MRREYVNPVYTDFCYVIPKQRREVGDILQGLVKKYKGVMPEVDFRNQLEMCSWSRRDNEEAPRLTVSWTLENMNEKLYKRLEEIFSESILDDIKTMSRDSYRKRKAAPNKFVGFDGHTTSKIRGFPLYRDRETIMDYYDLSREDKVLWVARNFSNVRDAKEKMKARGKNYWFYNDGRYIIDLRLDKCKEIEFIDTALRIGVALNGSYDSFNRYEALSLAQKQLARRNKQEVKEEDLIGLEKVVEDVKFRQFFATVKPKEAKALGITNESVLLVGVPGTGKSSIASSLLWDSMLEKIVFIPLNVTELLEAANTTEKYIETFFSGIRDMNRRYDFKPMLWCDDLESAFLEDANKSSRNMAVTQSTLLNNLQGVSKDCGIRISGSTNFPERIDPRFLEFGRISYMFHIPIPKNPAVLAEILSTHINMRGQSLKKDVDLNEISERSIGFTPRMLVNLVNEAGIQAAKRIFKRFSYNSNKLPKPLEVGATDYKKADLFLRSRSDLNLLKKRDEEIANFIEKHNRNYGF